jgi:sugar-specific transcriptional regulator TrmB
MESMLKKAEKSVYIMTSSEGILRKITHLEKTMKKVADKNVTIKVLVSGTKDADKVEKQLKGIAEVRTVSDVKSRFILVDDDKLLFFITNDKDVHPTYDVAVWIETSFFAESIKGFFELMWKKK